MGDLLVPSIFTLFLVSSSGTSFAESPDAVHFECFRFARVLKNTELDNIAEMVSNSPTGNRADVFNDAMLSILLQNGPLSRHAIFSFQVGERARSYNSSLTNLEFSATAKLSELETNLFELEYSTDTVFKDTALALEGRKQLRENSRTILGFGTTDTDTYVVSASIKHPADLPLIVHQESKLRDDNAPADRSLFSRIVESATKLLLPMR